MFLTVVPARMELLSAQKLEMTCRSWKGFCQVPLCKNSIKVASSLFMIREAQECQFMEGLMESNSGLRPLSEPSSPGSWVGGQQQLL